MGRLEGRVAIITGASRGIGRACALALAREGADVTLASKSVEPDPRLPGTLGEVAGEVEKLGRRALIVQTDVRFLPQIDAMVNKTVDTFGRVDILVNNAGAIWLAPVSDMTEKKWDLVHAINARAPHFAAQACLPHMIKQRWGHIVNMSPPIKTENAGGKVGYLISKFGMTLLTHGLAEEVREHNIAVHSLWPVTMIETMAVINFGLGTREMWRKPEIVADATVGLCAREPSVRSGRAWYDEEVLREDGITDFAKYAVVEGTEPPPIPW